ncbi:(2Fe-2S)-binding protein [Actinacidiphila sp. ITFR-21]|uniref:(2Fe-2S)-binding protein n=1 Tax=Actinacidiphila sp. ITFR-21 TaxID=3075199 RepID=UPI0028898279|nr:2Fe-2S iron-sulfur cluster-binding protein [Streptomyces sp. ITFR-21]WNI15733.1 (2Fe-2S)-binding protein [Streptomyces sp. ITFR-21]
MTDQPHGPGAPGNSGAWQPVPGGGDYDPDQTMHVSFAAQLPPEPLPGEDPLSTHGPAGLEPGEADPATQWSIPVIREGAEADSGEFSVGAYTAPWEQVSPPAAAPSFPAGMFGQGAAAAQAAQAEAAAQARAAEARAGHARAAEPLPPAAGDHLAGQWATPFTGPDGGDAVPWLPAHPPAADAAWSAVVDDPEGADPVPYGHPGALPAPAQDPRPAPHPADGNGLAAAQHAEPGPGQGPQAAPGTPAGLDARASLDDAPEAPPGAAGPGALPDPEPAAADAFGFDAADTGAGGPAADPEGGFATGGPDEGDGPASADVPGAAGPEPLPETRSEHPLASYMLRVNGTDRPVTDAWLGESLLYVLRERLGLAGAKDGCEQGECGACSVQVDGRLVASCLVPAATAAGSEVRTVEGLSADGRPSDVQAALAAGGAVQCGFCIPGMAMTVHDLLEGNHKPTDLDIRQALSGNLCRCSGYRGVIEAVRAVVAERDTDDDPAFSDEIRVPHQGGHGTAGGAA